MTAINFMTDKYFFADLWQAETLRISADPGLTRMSDAQRKECWELYNRAKKGEFRILGRNKVLLTRKLSKNFGFTYGASTVMEFATNEEMAEEEKDLHWQHARQSIQANKLGEIGLLYRQERQSSSDLSLPSSDERSVDYMTGTGAILATDNWTVLGNDAIILGTMHSALNKPCPHEEATVQFCVDESSKHESFLKNPMKYVWNSLRGPNFWNECITVTGRELLGLSHFGYNFNIYKNKRDILGIQFSIDSAQGYQRAINSTFTSYHHFVHNLQKNQSFVKQFFTKLIRTAHVERFESPHAQSSWRQRWAKRVKSSIFCNSSRRVHLC